MTDFLSGYANNYQYMTGVMRGTLSATNVPAGVGPFTNIAYRLIGAGESGIDWGNASEEEGGIYQEFEIWNATIYGPGFIAAGSYRPKPQDTFADAAGQEWNVKDAQSPDGVYDSTGKKPTVHIMCVMQV